LAEAIFQTEPNLEQAFGRPAVQVATEAIGHLAAVTALAEQLLAERAEWAVLAIRHGAALVDVAAAMDCTVTQVAELLWGAR
jgi:hypothetical protein